MMDQVWSGQGLEIGKTERRAEHATKRSEVECEDRSGGFPISPRQGVMLLLGLGCYSDRHRPA